MKHGMLSMIERLPGSKYKCLCECGNERIVKIGHFNTGKLKSCGCHWKTGKTGSKEQMSHNNMMARCHNPQNKRYKDYGAIGIVVCEEWRNNFKKFYKDMGPCPDGYQIDRIDNTKGYYKENCRWISPKENMKNRSVTKIWIVNGLEFTSSVDAAKHFGVTPTSIMAWCKGRATQSAFYAPKKNCGFRLLYENEKTGGNRPT